MSEDVELLEVCYAHAFEVLEVHNIIYMLECVHLTPRYIYLNVYTAVFYLVAHSASSYFNANLTWAENPRIIPIGCYTKVVYF
ncbi:hypothetical protein A3758_30670 [Oleiphilus sp. HI0118]|nr:hypothetical protein A3758_30670 [Oleiphilus sp. HI0118]